MPNGIKSCGLLGRKLTHSYSPFVHDAFDMGYSYGLFEVEPKDLSSFMKSNNFHGINVTIPYKKDVIQFCQEISPTAQAIGCVNTVVRLPSGSLFGYNTDGMGFLAMLKKSKLNIDDKKIIVLGSGGSSLTVCHILKKQNAGEIIVVSRDGINNYNNLQHDAQIIVNTTPVGMYPDTGKSLLNLNDFPKLEGVLDLIYNPAKTRLLMDAEALKIPAQGGLEMLVGQAAAASALFSGVKEIGKNSENNVITLLRQQMQNIILIGMPGCGKSTLGKILAEKLNKPFIDTDKCIEEYTKATIPDIFQREGEGGFRKIETSVLEEYGKKSGQVISTGGGCVTIPENFYHLSQNGVVIFIERDISLLEKEGRPLSKTGDLKNMYTTRLPMYKQFSDATVNNDNDPNKIAEKILEVFNEIISN